MSAPIILFYHCFFHLGEPPVQSLPAMAIIGEQMMTLKASGLEEAASEIYIGVNGGPESAPYAGAFPAKSAIVYHGLQCRNELRTIQLIEERVKALNQESYICYTHVKGGTFPPGDPLRTLWRNRMQYHAVNNWRQCVATLDSGVEACGCHWLTPEQYPGLVGSPYFAGTFFWARSSYLKTLPSITMSPAVKIHGMDAIESRYEAESWIGHGQRRPIIKDFHPGWPG